MYTGLELAIILYVIGFVSHMGLFRCFYKFYNFANDFITPAAWCFVWPIAWMMAGLWYVIKIPPIVYYAVEYVVSGQWNYK